MAKYYGKIGYSETYEKRPGVHENRIVEKSYYGDIIRDAMNLQAGENVLPDLSIGNAFSIVADPYSLTHWHAMRYIEWAGVLWSIKSIEVGRPRLTIRIGEVYNGPTA